MHGYTFEVCVTVHAALRLFIMQVLQSIAYSGQSLAVPPLFWPVYCMKIAGHVELLSGPNVYSVYCAPIQSRT